MNNYYQGANTDQQHNYYKIALYLAIFTVFYNMLEGLASVFLGISDNCLTLSGFGADSLIEVVSGFGILQMVLRIRIQGTEQRNQFEKKALRITGVAFYLLAAGLVLTAAYNGYVCHKPETTFWGVVISLISIVVMALLLLMKLRTGHKLGSEAIIADAHCTRVCIYMSVVLLVTSIIFEITGFAWIDIAGTIGLAWFSFSEGRECFEKVKNNICCGCHKT